MTHENILRFERNIKNSPRERCAIFSIKGQLILEKESKIIGTKEVCNFPDTEIEQITHKILTHNHPSGYLFTIKDLQFSVEANLNELRLVTENGTFSLKPKSHCWPNIDTIVNTLQNTQSDWDDIEKNEWRFKELAQNEGFNQDDHDWCIEHLNWESVASKIGLIYEFTFNRE